MFLLPGVELNVEESTSGDLKTVYKRPTPWLSTFLPAEGLGQAGLGPQWRRPGSEPYCLGLNAGSVTYWLIHQGGPSKPVSSPIKWR